MNISKFSRQIRREMTSDPKKAVILAGLLLLACYYWAPLAWGWVSKGDADRSEAQLAALAAPNNPGQVPAATADDPGEAGPAGGGDVAAPLHRWRTLVRWIDADPRTKPVLRVSGRRDPFTDQNSVRRIAGGPATMLDGPITPKNLGMTLTGIVISARRRVALIDGKAYVSGEQISVKLTAATKNNTPPRDVKTDDDASQASQGKLEKPRSVYFLLVEVRHLSVLLRREKKSYELKLPSPKPNEDAFVISFSSRKPSPGGP